MASGERRTVSRATLRRILAFAKPHRRALVWFVVLSIIGSLLTVATPVLAGRVVDEITTAGRASTVVALAILIAVVAVADAGFGLAERWQSAKIGEGVILDLRRAVFAHVQRMPVAFFMRTSTGALVSRLNNDVIGAQRAFTWTLSGVVSNVIALVLTLAVMLSLSWSITLLTLVLLPIFVIPARRMGSRLAHLEREAAGHNAAMTTQMTERFSAPGATLVKLFGDPPREEDEFGRRAERVAEIGVRSAMGQFVFLTALALVSALALALVYGLGGFLAVRGRLDAGTVVTMALLLGQLYAPLTALASARVDAMTALVSFERVFEVLDLEPLIDEAPDATTVPPGPVGVAFDDVSFAYPTADKVSLASLEEVATLDTRGGDEVLHDVSFSIEPGQVVALVGSSGAGKSTIASLLPRLYDVDSGSVSIGGVDVRRLTFESLRRTVGMVTQDGHLFHDSIRENLRFAAPEASEEQLWSALRDARLDGTRALPPGRSRHRRRRARLPAVGWRAAAADDRPTAARPAAGRDPRRGDVEPRLDVGGRRPGGAGHRPGGPHGAGDRPPAVDDHRRRPDPRRRGRPHRRARHATTSCSPPAVATPSCTGPNSDSDADTTQLVPT